MCWPCALVELRTGAELAAYVQVAGGSVDNCWCGWSRKMCKSLGDELNRRGRVVSLGDLSFNRFLMNTIYT